MWIVCENPSTASLFDRAVGMEKPVLFRGGKAQVSEKVGKALVEKYDHITALKEPEPQNGEEDDK